MSASVQEVHLMHDLEQLRGRVLRMADEHIDLLSTTVGALRKGKVDVAIERLEVVIDALAAERVRLRT